MAQQPMFTATGSAAIWQGAVSRCTATAVGEPPKAAGPMPRAFTSASSSSSKAAASALAAGLPT